jgi:hypothetical protein
MSSPWIIPYSSKPALWQARPFWNPMEPPGRRGPSWQTPKTKQADNSMHPGLCPRSHDGSPILPPDQPGSCRCPKPQGVHALENPRHDCPTVGPAFPGPGPHQQEPLPVIPYIRIMRERKLPVCAQVDTRPDSGHHSHTGPMGKCVRRDRVCTPAPPLQHLAAGTPFPSHRRGPDWEASLQMLTGATPVGRENPKQMPPRAKVMWELLYHSHQSPVHRCGSTFLAEWATR